MECPSCGFQNIPGLRQCARCQSLLDLVGLSIEPPRAPSGIVARLMRLWRREMTVIAARLAAARDGLRRMAPQIQGGDLGALAWSIIPGMGQLRRGHRVTGLLILGIWLLAIYGAVMGMGTPGGTLALMVALSVHAVSVGLVLAPGLRNATVGLRLLIGVSIVVLLQLLFYMPLMALADRAATLVRLQAVPVESPIVKANDLLVITGQWTRPEQFMRGDLVMFQMPRLSGQGWVTLPGPAIDRILAVPGDVVEVKRGVLTINGRPPPAHQGPLRPTVALPEMTWQPQPREYFVVPSLMLDAQRPDLTQQAVQAAGLLPDERIDGRVLWRLQPWDRFGGVQ